jgi:hypothetical protein
MDAMDLYYMGLCSHIVAEECEDTLAQALGSSLDDEDLKKAVQPKGMCLSSIEEMIEDMHVECSIDPLDDIIWDSYM